MEKKVYYFSNMLGVIFLSLIVSCVHKVSKLSNALCIRDLLGMMLLFQTLNIYNVLVVTNDETPESSMDSDFKRNSNFRISMIQAIKG